MKLVNFEITKKTKVRPPSLPFSLIKERVLGKNYQLSLVFVDSSISRKLNRTYRGKNKPANVLSFPLEKDSGEIFIDLVWAKKEASLFEKNFRNFVGLLFIHGLFHLKGLEHGSTMDRKEKQLREKFKID